jgi:aminoglycoside phosphotransferase (APT) family kinase protein
MLANDEPPSFHDVLDLLTRAGIVSRSKVVIDGVRIERLRGRNIGYLVEINGGDAFFVKYLHPRAGRLGVGKEAAVNRDIARFESSSLRRSLPTLLWHSEDMDVLVYSAAVGELTMSDQVRSGRPSQRLARDLATALAELHRSPAPAYKAQSPHGLLLHHPTLAELPARSAANLQLLRLIQGNDQLVDNLDHAAASWHSHTFVHADLKFDNILVRRGPDGRSQSVRIVDWEDAGAGDARWDVGAVFGAYLATWLTSIPHVRADSLSPLAPLARVKRETLLPSVRMFWECYAGRRQLAPEESRDFLHVAARYAGVRLVQAASEGTTAMPLTAVHLFLLQVGANMLARPRDAMTRLLGLQTGPGAVS